MRCLAIVLVLFQIAAQAPLQAQPVGKKRPEVVERWARLLERADEELQAGEWKKAKKTTVFALKEMCARIEGGSGVERLLAGATVLRAVAEAGLGNEAAAHWDFATAQTLVPALAESDFSAYGEAAQVLEAEKSFPRPAAKGEADPSSAPIERPRKIYAPPPKYPFGKNVACLDGTIVVQAIIDTEGRPSKPKLLTQQAPLLGYAALEAFRDWRFEPARRKGEPVPVYYNLSVNFKVPACHNPFARAAKGKKKKSDSQ